MLDGPVVANNAPLGIPLTGTLGVLLLAKEHSLVPLLAPLLDELHSAGLYLDPALVKRYKKRNLSQRLSS